MPVGCCCLLDLFGSVYLGFSLGLGFCFGDWVLMSGGFWGLVCGLVVCLNVLVWFCRFWWVMVSRVDV